MKVEFSFKMFLGELIGGFKRDWIVMEYSLSNGLGLYLVKGNLLNVVVIVSVCRGF